jgi:hypothetical protein
MRWLIRLSLILLILIPTSRSIAQTTPKISDVQLSYDFGIRLNIKAQIDQIQSYLSIYLILRPDGQSSRQVKLAPRSDGSINIQFDLEKDPLKPYARIYYWFEFEDQAHTTTSSPAYWFDYSDNRFGWKSNESNLFRIFWVEGDTGYGQQIQDIAREGLKKSTQILPIPPNLPIQLFVYPDLTSLQGALSLTKQSWTAGHTSPDIGVILVSNSSQSVNLSELERQIPHELMHILQYQITGDQYGSIPVWLSEGLATYSEMYPDPDQARILNESYTQGKLIPFESLCSGFSQDAASAQIGYAQSVSFVSYLKNRFGSEIFPALLENANSGQSCTQSIQKVLQVPLSQLEKDWQEDTFGQTSEGKRLSLIFPIILVIVLVGLLILFIYLKTKSSKVGPNNG